MADGSTDCLVVFATCMWQIWGAPVLRAEPTLVGAELEQLLEIFKFRSEGGRTCNNLQHWKMQLSIKSNRNWKASSEREPAAHGSSPLPTPLHTSEWENINYTTAIHVFQKTKSVLFSHATVRHRPCPAGIAISKNTSCIPAAAEGNATLTWNMAQQRVEKGKDTTADLCLIFWLPPGPLHLQPLTPTPRWNEVIASPRFVPDSVWALWLCKMNWALQTLQMRKQTLLQILFRVSVIHVLLRAIISFLLLPASPLTISQ